MLEKQNFLDLEEHDEDGNFITDPISWLSEDHTSSSSHHSLSNNNNFDRVIYKNLVEMVPLIETLMDRKANNSSSFTRRATMVCTKTPTKDSFSKKGGEPKGRKIAQSIPTKMQRNIGENNPSKDTSVDEFIPSRPSTLEKDKEQMILLQEQVDNLQKKVLEKDELLKSAETSMNQMNVVHAKVDELKRQIAEKETLIKSAHLQLSDARVKLADKQATLEKIQWEATTSNKKVEELQDEMESVQGEKAAFMLLFESLTSDDCTGYAENYDVFPSYSDQLPSTDDISETEMLEMEEARQAYISALAAAKENQDEDLLAIATQARVRLQSFLRSESSNSRSFLRSESSNNRNMSVY
ncbi:hypothetical protein IFM89_004035 [Coptis chinensis]|uniref:Uncharacterized protein n=1 Tax=Coptis chinensis TaxID=261450 RepID=A0A835GX94_9MAGN|nr:hypothetical protein IFM89_004035 [Coptis chinensis]